MRKIIISWVLLFACNLMWSLQFTCIKLTQDQVGPYFTVWAPMLFAVLLLAPFVFRDFRRRQKVKGHPYICPSCDPGRISCPGTHDMGNSVLTCKQLRNSYSYTSRHYCDFCIPHSERKNEQDKMAELYYCNNRRTSSLNRRY